MPRLTTTSLSVILTLLLPTAASAQSAAAVVQDVLASPGFKSASAELDRRYDQFVGDLIALTEVPAPPLKEATRAEAFAKKLRETGLADVQVDEEGNVMGVRRGVGRGPMLAVLAHLDTVFPEGTPTRVRREGTRLYAPGAGDDTAGLATELAIIRAMDSARLQTESDILFVANVGEEADGNLRGVKYLLQRGRYKDSIKTFISLDGGIPGNVVNGALGSRKYRVTFKGPGGHSYNAFGLVNPGFAMANALARMSRIQVPALPKTTYNFGLVGGGTSVNSIPNEMYMEADLRSVSPVELQRLDQTFRKAIQEAVDEENTIRSTAQGKVSVEVNLVGDRPSGETPATHFLVQVAIEATKAFGLTPKLDTQSTDANLPISLGIPAITIGHWRGGRAHSLDEWVDVEKTSVLRSVNIGLVNIMAAVAKR